MTTQEILEAARSAKSALALADNTARNAALLGMADALCSADDQAAILAANAEDMAAAKGHISDVMLDRLALTAPRIEAMAQGIREVAALPDPVGRVLNRVERPNGLVIEKTAVPMGVIAIIYESRPNVTSDAAALAIKSGNACILRCGKEAWRSANAIVTALRQGLKKAGLPETAVCLIEDTTHASANALMTAVGYVDLLIPAAVPGLFIGCLIANITGGAVIWDIVFGSLATLIGAVGTYMLRKHPWAAPLPPILANTVIVPFVLKYAYGTEGMLWYFMLTVGLGEVIVCGVLGSLLRVALKKYRNTLFHE